MASLRRTRRFSSSPTPSELQQPQRNDQDPYYDDSHILDASVLPSSSLAQDTTSQRGGDRSRLNVRKTKSQLSVNPPQNSHDSEEDEHYRPPSSRRNATRDVSPNGIEYRIGRKRQDKESKSRYPRSKDVGTIMDARYSRQTPLPGEENQQLSAPTTPAPRFLVPKSNARSQSRSPSPMPLNYHPEGQYSRSIDPQSDAVSHLDSMTTSTGMPRFRSRSSSKAADHRDMDRSSGLPVSSSRAPSPLPPQTLTLGTLKSNVDSSARNESSNHGHPESPAVQVPSRTTSALSSLPLSTHDQSAATHPRVTHGTRSQSQTLHAGPVTVSSSQLSTSAMPRTLKEVTRLLEDNRGKVSQRNLSRQPEPAAHNLDERLSRKSSPKYTPISSNKQNENDRSTLSPDAKIGARIDPLWRARSKHGLALTTEKGHILGDPPAHETSQTNWMPPARRGTNHENAYRPNITPPLHIHATRPSILSKSGYSTEFYRNTGSATNHNSSSGGVSERGKDRAVPQVSSRLMREKIGITADVVQSAPNYISGTQLKERHNWSQGQGKHDRALGANRFDLTSTSAHYSSLSSLPKPLPKPRQKMTTARFASVNVSTPTVARSERSVSHKHRDSDASVGSSRRTRKLVIRNLSPDDRLSSESSSNLGLRNSNAATTSEDYTILALSGTQTSLGQINDVDYLVPDDVAEGVANEEERRRKALAGLVNDLHLVSLDRDESQHTHDRKANRTEVPVTFHGGSHHSHEDDEDDDDDAFFARLNMPDNEDSLLEEPEPDADSFKGYDESHLEEERSESDPSETDEGDLVLPPTPKFVHPLGEGDDLESRITRVTSLNRIMPTLPSPRSYDLEQGHHSRFRPESPGISKPTSTASKKELSFRSKRGDLKVTSGGTGKQWRSRSGSDPPELNAGEFFDESFKGDEATDPTPATEFFQVVSSSRSDDTSMVMDNGPPSAGDGRLSEVNPGNNETLSPGAEALFKQLQSEAEAEAQEASRREILPSDKRFDLRRERSHIFQEGKSSSFISEPRPENYDIPSVNTQEPTLLRTWRSTLTFGAYDSLAERHGASEMQRQEIIWELCETEQAFVKSLRLILRLFVQPLRHEDKTWIPGVPRDVTRLFDWFDDVMHLHSQISSALHAARSSQYPVVIQIAETLRPFVPRLELHQPYLVRLESVSAAIEVMSKDLHSEFGEFVRIQSASPECESMDLLSFLLKPVQRLMKYPLFFKRLLEFTPRSHTDHLPTFSLLHSTDMIIKVMQEVKTREEEYELVKNLASRIKGLPSGYQLARRERRLVAQGLLHRVILTDEERIAIEKSADAQKIQSLQSTLGMRMASTSSENSSFAGDWAYHPTRKGDTGSFGTVHGSRGESITSDSSLYSTTNVSRSTSRSRSSSLRGSLRRKSKESSVYAFIFTDLIILTTPMPERIHVLRSPKNASEGKETWKLIDDLGVSRVLGVADQSGQLPNHEHLIAVELMSMTPNLLDFGPLSSGSIAGPVYLTLPFQGTSTLEGNDDTLLEAKAKWFDAFERCFRFTLRSLSFPSYTGKHGSSGGTDLELDTKNSVMSILSSGLPLPMSPSQQLEETQRGRPTDPVQEEREERGWWSLRFHQVLKEVQRSSGSPVFEPASIRKNDIRNKRRGGKRSEPRPLILSPNPSIAIAPSRKNSLLSLGKKKSK